MRWKTEPECAYDRAKMMIAYDKMRSKRPNVTVETKISMMWENGGSHAREMLVS